ncbi:heme oxygenase-like protein [Acephala macrosclerotiorum]|nr:heme oxygenase-like protein [Acephala macrosclerotiorum]
MADSSRSLTQHLLSLSPSSFKLATQTPFLIQAGCGTLSKEILEKWVFQDRLYAQAYVRFGGRLLAGLAGKLPSRVDSGDVNERLLDLVLDAVNNVRRELKFFEDVLEGLVLLWGTEICYLEAWRYAKSFTEGSEGEEDSDGGALRKEFIPNWTSDEFAEFVEKIGGFVDEVWESIRGGSGNEEMLKRVEGIWREVLDIEQVFWPVVEG